MPTQKHEFLIDLVRGCPELIATLLTQTGVPVPPFEEAWLSDSNFPDCVPTEFRADSVVVLMNGNAPVSAVVLEVQRKYDEDKLWAWPVYLSTLRKRQKCPVLLLVFCEDAKTAQRCAEPIDMGHPGWVLCPIVIGPDGIPMITDLARAIDEPELTAVSAVVYGQSEAGVETVLTLLEALKDLPSKKSYADLVFSCLPDNVFTKVMEAWMPMGTYQPRSKIVREWVAEGEAEAILLFLEARGIPVSDEGRTRITECTDLDVLKSWIRKAAIARSADEIFD
ncbi:hypothetical protein ACTMTI_01550 [Nonomuraea sp. H19]|uniref:hypothetical protein n=1 Tax=Nonomuraea sp. H19 TaxID=3452206 RepID=UPI003F88DBA0